MDLVELSQTNMPPTSEEETIALERLTSLDIRLSKLDEQVSLAQQVVDELKPQQTQLQEKRRTYVSIISPLRRLPSEIIVEIMFFAVWSPQRKEDFMIKGGPLTGADSTKEPKQKIIRPLESHMLQVKQLLNFMLVSQRWRRLAHGTPRLWAHFELSLYSDNRPLQSLVPPLQIWFDRAQELPLSLKLVYSNAIVGSDLETEVFARFLERNRRRWKELRLHMNCLGPLLKLFQPGRMEGFLSKLSLDDVGGALLDGGSKGEGEEGGRDKSTDPTVWAQLETLSIFGEFCHGMGSAGNGNLDDTGSQGAVEDPWPVDVLPRLATFDLFLPFQTVSSWSWIPWSRLTELKLSSRDVYDDYLGILKSCCSLKRCYISFEHCYLSRRTAAHDDPVNDDSDVDNNDNIVTAGGHESDDDDVHLLHLEELILDPIQLGYIAPFFSRLVLPSLSRLCVRQDKRYESGILVPGETIGHALIRFIQRSINGVAGDEGSASGSLSTPFSLRVLDMDLYEPIFLEYVSPQISDRNYVEIFEHLGLLEELHLKDGVTRAGFFEAVGKHGLLPSLRTISIDVGQDEEARRRFEGFVKARTLA
ncbi:hypothetical protein FA15DRAFT_597829 [Coprinopsis marcescibilis]|uniref:Uncharacterized protein n=1 Tax=Coprinopsis marcescibilis TaxID=230819 RepID=A0A5C3KN24_COPMA|nr:hypothetical protein FA15DRAFT_597829 [Coprinopsis marcescibilis]